MAEKPKLYYFNGRGRMEQIRWLLAAAGVEVCVSLFIDPENCWNIFANYFSPKDSSFGI